MVRRLSLALGRGRHDPSEDEWRPPLRAVLEACQSARALEEVTCHPMFSWMDPHDEWASLRTVRKLSFVGGAKMQADLSQLTALRCLHLRLTCHWGNLLGQRARLPPALTRLTLGSAWQTEPRPDIKLALPSQVRVCSSLLAL